MYKIEQFLTTIIIFLFPLQIYGINVNTTIFDLSGITFIALVSVLIYKNLLRLNTLFIIFVSIFLLIEIILFIINSVPIYRFASGVLWIGSFMIIFGTKYFNKINFKKLYTPLLLAINLSLLYIFFEIVVLGAERPSGTFSEPSTAGLVFLSTAAGFIFLLPHIRSKINKLLLILYIFMLLYTSSIVMTTHIVSLLISLILSYSVYIRISLKSFIIMIIIGLIGLIVIYNSEHMMSRIDIGGDELNLSQLAWMAGFDQMFESMKSSPIFGQGLGGAGFFNFESQNTDLLASLGAQDLNSLDAYSGLFRLVIELGTFLSLFVVFALIKNIIEFRSYIINMAATSFIKNHEIIFIFIFSQTLIIGILLKEAVWSRSVNVLAILLFFGINIKKMKKSSNESY